MYENISNSLLLLLLILITQVMWIQKKAKERSTLQPLYNMVRYNMVLDNTVFVITQFKDGSQKCIDYIEKRP